MEGRRRGCAAPPSSEDWHVTPQYYLTPSLHLRCLVQLGPVLKSCRDDCVSGLPALDAVDAQPDAWSRAAGPPRVALCCLRQEVCSQSKRCLFCVSVSVCLNFGCGLGEVGPGDGFAFAAALPRRAGPALWAAPFLGVWVKTRASQNWYTERELPCRFGQVAGAVLPAAAGGGM